MSLSPRGGNGDKDSPSDARWSDAADGAAIESSAGDTDAEAHRSARREAKRKVKVEVSGMDSGAEASGDGHGSGVSPFSHGDDEGSEVMRGDETAATVERNGAPGSDDGGLGSDKGSGEGGGAGYSRHRSHHRSRHRHKRKHRRHDREAPGDGGELLPGRVNRRDFKVGGRELPSRFASDELADVRTLASCVDGVQQLGANVMVLREPGDAAAAFRGFDGAAPAFAVQRRDWLYPISPHGVHRAPVLREVLLDLLERSTGGAGETGAPPFKGRIHHAHGAIHGRDPVLPHRSARIPSSFASDAQGSGFREAFGHMRDPMFGQDKETDASGSEVDTPEADSADRIAYYNRHLYSSSPGDAPKRSWRVFLAFDEAVHAVALRLLQARAAEEQEAADRAAAEGMSEEETRLPNKSLQHTLIVCIPISNEVERPPDDMLAPESKEAFRAAYLRMASLVTAGDQPESTAGTPLGSPIKPAPGRTFALDDGDRLASRLDGADDADSLSDMLSPSSTADKQEDGGAAQLDSYLAKLPLSSSKELNIQAPAPAGHGGAGAGAPDTGKWTGTPTPSPSQPSVNVTPRDSSDADLPLLSEMSRMPFLDEFATYFVPFEQRPQDQKIAEETTLSAKEIDAVAGLSDGLASWKMTRLSRGSKQSTFEEDQAVLFRFFGYIKHVYSQTSASSRRTTIGFTLLQRDELPTLWRSFTGHLKSKGVSLATLANFTDSMARALTFVLRERADAAHLPQQVELLRQRAIFERRVETAYQNARRHADWMSWPDIVKCRKRSAELFTAYVGAKGAELHAVLDSPTGRNGMRFWEDLVKSDGVKPKHAAKLLCNHLLVSFHTVIPPDVTSLIRGLRLGDTLVRQGGQFKIDQRKHHSGPKGKHDIITLPVMLAKPLALYLDDYREELLVTAGAATDLRYVFFEGPRNERMSSAAWERSVKSAFRSVCPKAPSPRLLRVSFMTWLRSETRLPPALQKSPVMSQRALIIGGSNPGRKVAASGPERNRGEEESYRLAAKFAESTAHKYSHKHERAIHSRRQSRGRRRRAGKKGGGGTTTESSGSPARRASRPTRAAAAVAEKPRQRPTSGKIKKSQVKSIVRKLSLNGMDAAAAHAASAQAKADSDAAKKAAREDRAAELRSGRPKKKASSKRLKNARERTPERARRDREEVKQIMRRLSQGNIKDAQKPAATGRKPKQSLTVDTGAAPTVGADSRAPEGGDAKLKMRASEARLHKVAAAAPFSPYASAMTTRGRKLQRNTTSRSGSSASQAREAATAAIYGGAVPPKRSRFRRKHAKRRRVRRLRLGRSPSASTSLSARTDIHPSTRAADAAAGSGLTARTAPPEQSAKEGGSTSMPTLSLLTPPALPSTTQRAPGISDAGASGRINGPDTGAGGYRGAPVVPAHVAGASQASESPRTRRLVERRTSSDHAWQSPRQGGKGGHSPRNATQSSTLKREDSYRTRTTASSGKREVVCPRCPAKDRALRGNAARILNLAAKAKALEEKVQVLERRKDVQSKAFEKDSLEVELAAHKMTKKELRAARGRVKVLERDLNAMRAEMAEMHREVREARAMAKSGKEKAATNRRDREIKMLKANLKTHTAQSKMAESRLNARLSRVVASKMLAIRHFKTSLEQLREAKEYLEAVSEKTGVPVPKALALGIDVTLQESANIPEIDESVSPVKGVPGGVAGGKRLSFLRKPARGSGRNIFGKDFDSPRQSVAEKVDSSSDTDGAAAGGSSVSPVQRRPASPDTEDVPASESDAGPSESDAERADGPEFGPPMADAGEFGDDDVSGEIRIVADDDDDDDEYSDDAHHSHAGSDGDDYSDDEHHSVVGGDIQDEEQVIHTPQPRKMSSDVVQPHAFTDVTGDSAARAVRSVRPGA